MGGVQLTRARSAKKSGMSVRIRSRLLRMGHRKKLMAGAATTAMVAFASVAALQARAVARKAGGVRAGMSCADVSRQLDGWAMINAHPLGRGTQNRAKPGPEYL